MQCPECQHENPTEAKFCLHCGTRLATVCPQCQQVLPPEAKFCMACGHALTASPQPTAQPVTEGDQPAPHTPDAERRQLTVMFCDLTGSTRLSGQLDPEDLREVIRAYQETAAGVIQRYDGHIAQYLGDGLLVYFGWPQAHEDDAQRGVRAGLGIVAAIDTLNTRLEQDKSVCLAVRIGVHTGPVVIGEMGGGGRHEQLALGETTNIAARLEGMAQPNTLVISDTTYRLIEGYFTCDALDLQTLKGVATPMQLYRVLQATGVQGRLEVTLARGLTPLVGREQEVGLLLERWAQVKEGQGQVVLLSGEAGLGKSRLIQVLKDHVADAPHTRLECRSLPYYQNTAWYPITDLLQRVLQWQQDDSPEQRLEKLERELSRYRLPLEETVPLFATLLSLPLSEDRYSPLTWTPQRQRQKTLESIVAMLLELAEHQPVLFILEDMHWTDPTTLELLGLLMDQAPTASILTVLTCRPEFESPWGLRSHLTPIALNRFNRLHIEAMVTHVADDKTLPPEVMQHLVEKTDGVPLYVEEITKAILASEVLQEANDHYALAGPLTSLSIPATLQDSLMSRLDRLGTAKSIAQLGATIGRQFSYELIQAVSSQDELVVWPGLAQLVEAELLYQRGSLPNATFTFKHALVQETAYQSLLRSTRQDYHQRIAQVLAEQFPERAEMQPELLAHHYMEAGQDEVAIRYWQRAGQRAIQRSANAEAIGHLTQGLTVLTTLSATPTRQQQELDLQVALGPALITVQGNSTPDVERVYTRALELCEQIGDTSQMFLVLRGLILHYQGRGLTQAALQFGEQLFRLAQAQPEPAHLLLAHHLLGFVLFYRGELASARTHHQQAFAIYNPQEHQALAFRYGNDLGVASGSCLAWELWQLGYPDQALQHSQKAYRLAQKVSHPFSLVVALTFPAILHQFRHEASAVHNQAEAGMTLATEQGFTLFLAMGTVLHGWALVMQGQVEAGIAEMRRGLAANLAVGAKLYQPYFLGLLAEAYGEGGHPEEGLNTLAEALAEMDITEIRFYESELYRLKGELLLQQSPDNQPEAEISYQRAINVARSQQAKSWELRAAMSLARLWQKQGHRQDAYDLLAPIYDWFTEGFDTANLQEAEALLHTLTSRGN